MIWARYHSRWPSRGRRQSCSVQKQTAHAQLPEGVGGCKARLVAVHCHQEPLLPGAYGIVFSIQESGADQSINDTSWRLLGLAELPCIKQSPLNRDSTTVSLNVNSMEDTHATAPLAYNMLAGTLFVTAYVQCKPVCGMHAHQCMCSSVPAETQSLPAMSGRGPLERHSQEAVSVTNRHWHRILHLTSAS